MLVSFIIPTYNEAENLPRLVAAYFALPVDGLRLVIVDDNSPDGTGQIADQLTAQFPGGTLYNLLKRMLADGWIEETGERPDPQLDDERRRYYRLTGLGGEVLRLEAERMAHLVGAARRRGLLPELDGQP